MASHLSPAYQAARQVTRHHAKTFYLASFGLPRTKRIHSYAVYAFCRYVDDVIDRAPDFKQIPKLLIDLEAFTHRAFEPKIDPQDLNTCPWLPAFQNTVKECDIPKTYFLDLLEGVRMDQGPVQIQTWPELDRYCYHVAGVVGLMMTRVFGLKERAYEAEALHLGTAMQLTNILRDVGEDFRKNRIYLPAEELKIFGLSEQDIANGKVTDSWKKLIQFQIDRAREYYLKSERGISKLENDGSQLAVWMMRHMYAGILEEIKKNDYDIFSQRTYVPFPRKILLIIRSIQSLY